MVEQAPLAPLAPRVLLEKLVQPVEQVGRVDWVQRATLAPQAKRVQPDKMVLLEELVAQVIGVAPVIWVTWVMQVPEAIVVMPDRMDLPVFKD